VFHNFCIFWFFFLGKRSYPDTNNIDKILNPMLRIHKSGKIAWIDQTRVWAKRWGLDPQIMMRIRNTFSRGFSLFCLSFLSQFNSMFRMHWFGSPGSGCVLGMLISIQEERRNWPRLTSKPDFQPFKMAFVPKYVGTYVLWQLPTWSTFFMSKSNFLWRQSLTRIRIRMKCALVWLPGLGSGSAWR